jgi:hypothetical protein
MSKHKAEALAMMKKYNAADWAKLCNDLKPKPTPDGDLQSGRFMALCILAHAGLIRKEDLPDGSANIFVDGAEHPYVTAWFSAGGLPLLDREAT